MKKYFFNTAIALFFLAESAFSQNLLPAKWEELRGSQFENAVEQSNGVCVIPMGVIEKHGTHLPLGTDVYQARHIAEKAAQKEYAIIFPYYYTGVISEAKHQPGTISYSPELLMNNLQESCTEISRNGIKKIIIFNIHGGNPQWLQYFCRTQLSSARDYAVYLVMPSLDEQTQKKISALRKSSFDSHAGELETSKMLNITPELVDMTIVGSESGEDQKRVALNNVFTAISWYSRFPNHYAGDAKDANRELGEIMLEQQAQQLTDIIKAVKEDSKTLPLMQQFYKEALSPLNK